MGVIVSARIDSLFNVNIKSPVHAVSSSGELHLLLHLAATHAVPHRTHRVTPIARFPRLLLGAGQCERRCISMLGVEVSFGALT